ncbi:MAG TPA: hypothetical protein VJ819_15265, partial [Nocardioidaceae bacterium]|nr:hypothetical protein [Nocardioidaceae bacterium]
MAGDRNDAKQGRSRLRWSVGLASGVLLTAVLSIPSSFGDDAAPPQQTRSDDSARARLAAAAEALAPVTHDHSAHEHGGHDHSDPATKNAVSRTTGNTVSADTKDPTTARQAAAARETVAAQRDEADPELLPISRETRRDKPEDRYAMAGGCYALQAPDDRWVLRAGDGFTASATHIGAAEPFHFQATDLGKYLLFGTEHDFVARAPGGPLGPLGPDKVESAEAPGQEADWTVTDGGATYRFTLGSTGQELAVDRTGALVLATTGDRFALQRTEGCASWPEVEVNISGRTFRGASDMQEVRGYLDAHTHGMAFEFLGGEVHCGRPWHPYGVQQALVDCEDHQVADGNGAVLENV